MKDMEIKPLTEKDRKQNEYMDKINREPWPIIFFAIIGFLGIFTTLVLLGTF